MPHATPLPITPPSLILVTGANGFIASHTIHALLLAGFRVHGTVRTAAKATSITSTINHLLPKHSHNFTTSLIPSITSPPTAYTSLLTTLQPTAILHLASPFTYTVTDYDTDLMQPAVAGTLTLLRAASQCPSVKRVIHLNSFACVYDAAQGPRPGYIYTAADFSPLTYADGAANARDAATAYRASKAVAEQTAWSFMREHPEVGFDYVSLLPAMVFGPFLDSEDAMPTGLGEVNTSNKLVWECLSAKEVPVTKGPVWVDVRDVAEAQVRCLGLEEVGGRRLLLAKGVWCAQEVADLGREVLGQERWRGRVPRGVVGRREWEGHFGVDAGEEERLLTGKVGGWRGLRECVEEVGNQLFGIEEAEMGRSGPQVAVAAAEAGKGQASVQEVEVLEVGA